MTSTVPTSDEFDADPDDATERVHRLKNDLLAAVARLDLMTEQFTATVEEYRTEHPSS